MLKIVTFDSLVFKQPPSPRTLRSKNLLFTLKKGYRATAEFTNGTRVSVVYGYGAYGEGPLGSGIALYEAFFSDEDDPRGYQTKEELDEEFLNRSIPSEYAIWKKVK
jgi:hypothetical protein